MNVTVTDQLLILKMTKIGIVVSEFNEEVTSKLCDGAISFLMYSGTPQKNISIVKVPGAFEIPFAASELIKNKKADGVIALGAVIRGETDHYDFICQGVTNGIMDLQLATGVPIAFGVLTTDTEKQALNRAGGKLGNKGEEAAETLLKMFEIQQNIKSTSRNRKKSKV